MELARCFVDDSHAWLRIGFGIDRRRFGKERNGQRIHGDQRAILIRDLAGSHDEAKGFFRTAADREKQEETKDYTERNAGHGRSPENLGYWG
jgi:hypothetical protein